MRSALMATMTLIVAGLGAGCAGSASADQKTYNLGDFTSVSVSAGVHVTWAKGPVSIVAEEERGRFDDLKISNDGGRLQIGHKGNASWFNSRNYQVRLTAPSLSAVSVSSGAHFEGSGVDLQTFALNASSGAHAEVSGKCGSITGDASSGAHADAGGLICANATASASSGAHLQLSASQKVTANASSGAHVEVSGGAKDVTSDQSSGGRVSVRGRS